MKKIKVLAVLAATSFVFSIAGPAFAAVNNISTNDSSDYSLQKEFMSPAQAAKVNNTLADVNGTSVINNIDNVTRDGDDLFINSNGESIKVPEQDKGKVEAYPPENLFNETDGKSVKIMTSYSYSYSSPIPNDTKNADGQLYDDETVKLQSSDKEIHIGTFFNKNTNRNVYVELPENISNSIDAGEISADNVNVTISIKDNANYIKTDDGKYVIAKENVDFSVKEDVWNSYNVTDVKRNGDSISVTANGKTMEIKGFDKGKLEAYPAENLFVETNGQDVKIMTSYSYSYSSPVPKDTWNAKGEVSNVENVKLQNSNTEISVGTFLNTATNRQVNVEIPKEYANKNVTVTVNITENDNTKYIKTDDGKYVIPKENVKFSVKADTNVQPQPVNNNQEKVTNTTNGNANVNTQSNDNKTNAKVKANAVTYSQIKIAKNKKGAVTNLVIYDRNGKKTKINTKGMSKKQINNLVKYFNKNLKDKKKNSKAAKKALSNLKKKANKIRTINDLKSNKKESNLFE